MQNEAYFEAFNFAIDWVNSDPTILPNIQLQGVGRVETQAWDIVQSVCRQISEGAVAIVGPQMSSSSEHVHAIVSDLKVPLLSPTATLNLFSQPAYTFFNRVVPTNAFLGTALTDVVSFFKWKSVALLYTHDSYTKELMEPFRSSRFNIVTSQRFSPQNLTSLSHALLVIKKSHARIVVVACPASFVPTLLNETNNLDMWKNRVWVGADSFNDADAEGLLSVSPFVNTSDTSNAMLQAFLARWRELKPNFPVADLPAYAYFVVDAVFLLARSLHQVQKQNVEYVGINQTVACLGSEKLWVGQQLSDQLRSMRPIPGLTGAIALDEAGDRDNSKFVVLNHVGGVSRVVGYWEHGKVTQLEPIIWPNEKTETPMDFAELDEQHFVVITTRVPPFYDPLTGNGLISRLLTHLQNELNFNVSFEIRETVDESLHELISQEHSYTPHIAAGDITMTREREVDFDFTHSFWITYLRVVIYNNPDASKASIWQFMSPFHWSAWLMLLVVGFVLGSVLFYFEAGLWDDIPVSPLGFLTALYWAFSAILTAERRYPKSYLGHSAVFCLGVVLTVFHKSYKAMLTANLTTESLRSTITGFQSLNGKRVTMFKDDAVRASVEQSSTLRPVDVNSMEEHWQKLESGQADAAIMFDWQVNMFLRDEVLCKKFVAVGEPFSPLGIAFAFQKGSTFVHNFSQRLSAYRESGWLNDTIAQVTDTYFPNTCKTVVDKHVRPAVQPTFMAGLVIVVTSVVAIGIIFHFVKKYRKRNVSRVATPASSSKSSSEAGSVVELDHLTSTCAICTAAIPPVLCDECAQREQPLLLGDSEKPAVEWVQAEVVSEEEAEQPGATASAPELTSQEEEDAEKPDAASAPVLTRQEEEAWGEVHQGGEELVVRGGAHEPEPAEAGAQSGGAKKEVRRFEFV